MLPPPHMVARRFVSLTPAHSIPQVLLAGGANKEAAARDGEGALHVAAISNRLATVLTLLAAGWAPAHPLVVRGYGPQT